MITGSNALAFVAALAALLVAAVTYLAAIGAEVPAELSGALTIIVSAVAGGGIVKGADALRDRRAEEIRRAWNGDGAAQ